MCIKLCVAREGTLFLTRGVHVLPQSSGLRAGWPRLCIWALPAPLWVQHPSRTTLYGRTDCFSWSLDEATKEREWFFQLHNYGLPTNVVLKQMKIVWCPCRPQFHFLATFSHLCFWWDITNLCNVVIIVAFTTIVFHLSRGTDLWGDY